MASLLVGAFLAHWEEWTLHTEPASDDWISERSFLGILAALMAVALGGLASTIARKSP